MTTAKSRIQVNLIYGAIALLPLLILAYVFYKLHGITKKVAVAVAPVLGESSLYGTGIILLMMVLGLVLICFLVGALVNSRLGATAFERVQSTFGAVVPGYEIVANLMRGVAGNQKAYPAALISLFAPGTSVLGFVMEESDGPYLTVFVPSTPVITVGSIHVVERSRVRMLEATSRDAAECLGQWGLGMGKLLPDAEPERG